MDREDILQKLEEIFREFFDDDEIALSEETEQDSIDDWDSVAHIQLIFEIEDAFDVEFPAADIANLTSIKAIIDALSR